MMPVYLLAKAGVILYKFREAFQELLTHYCSSEPVISLPTVHHRPHSPGGAVGSMFALCPGELSPSFHSAKT